MDIRFEVFPNSRLRADIVPHASDGLLAELSQVLLGRLQQERLMEELPGFVTKAKTPRLPKCPSLSDEGAIKMVLRLALAILSQVSAVFRQLVGDPQFKDMPPRANEKAQYRQTTDGQERRDGRPPLGPDPHPFQRAYRTRLDRLVGDEPPQVFAHSLGRLVPRLGVLVDRLEHDRFQVPWDPRIDSPGPLRLLGLDSLDQLEPVRRAESRTQREQLVERQTQRVDVGPSVAFAPKPLRRHVADRTQDVTTLGQPLVVSLGQAEIRDPDHPFGVQQQVRRLDVPVHDPPRMSVGEASRHLPANLRDATEEPPPTRLGGGELGTPG